MSLIPTEINVDAWMKGERQNVAQGQGKALCFSFYSILLAVGNPVVDYFSLDVEGAELPILKSIPWEKVNIKVNFFYFKNISYNLNNVSLSLLLLNIFIINLIAGFVHRSQSLGWQKN